MSHTHLELQILMDRILSHCPDRKLYVQWSTNVRSSDPVLLGPKWNFIQNADHCSALFGQFIGRVTWYTLGDTLFVIQSINDIIRHANAIIMQEQPEPKAYIISCISRTDVQPPLPPPPPPTGWLTLQLLFDVTGRWWSPHYSYCVDTDDHNARPFWYKSLSRIGIVIR